MRIAVDMDGILADLLPIWLERYSRDSGHELYPEDITAWSAESFVREEWKQRFLAYLYEPGFFFGLPPIEGAKEGVRALQALGHEICIVSHPPFSAPTAAYDKLRWLAQHFPSIPSSNVVFTQGKHLIAAPLLIDDSPKYAASFPGKVILVDYPYNRDCNGIPRFYRPRAWENIVHWFAGLFYEDLIIEVADGSENH